MREIGESGCGVVEYHTDMISLHERPVAIGGIGGSGTRVVAQLLMALGYFMGDKLNLYNDNLAFTRKFKCLDALESADEEFRQLVSNFVEEMETGCCNAGAKRWGWKEPNTHVLIDRFVRLLPGLLYIHVIRNGFDMAYSRNQNQARLWGPYFLEGKSVNVVSPGYALKFWCAVHRRIFRIANSPEVHGRFFFLNFDDLCQSPSSVLRSLCSFLDVSITEKDMDRLTQFIMPPSSFGRWRAGGLDVFDREDVDYVTSIGFKPRHDP